MDHGRDAALSVRYHKEHELAADALRPSGQSFMSRLRKPELLKMSLSELREAGITPTVIASSGATWSQLCKAYGASALLDMGFEWRHLRACGITGEQACSLGMDALHVDASQLMEVRPTIASVASMQMPLQSLKSRGFTMDRLLALGLDSGSMRRFGHGIKDWASTFECDWRNLGFADFVTAERQGWPREELHAAGVFGAPALAPAAPAKKAGPLDFF
tara:strand:- start:85 stop:738 length:654 start_codon:yes stop_codon:yes gene_type:complete